MSPKQDIALAKLDTRIVDGVGPSLDTEGLKDFTTFLLVTATSGVAPALVVTIQESPDDLNFLDTYTFISIATPTTMKVSAATLGRSPNSFIRAKWTITGTTPSFTFSVRLLPMEV